MVKYLIYPIIKYSLDQVPLLVSGQNTECSDCVLISLEHVNKKIDERKKLDFESSSKFVKTF